MNKFKSINLQSLYYADCHYGDYVFFSIATEGAYLSARRSLTYYVKLLSLVFLLLVWCL